MGLGENIYRLRTGRGMSQDELSDCLGVSRQSISKWENDSSVPELERLVQMADIFGVSLDALVKGEQSGSAPPTQTPVERPAERGASGSQRTLGAVLLIAGVLVALFLFLLGGGLFSLMAAAPFLLCGIVCLAVRRRAGLWCVWAVWLSVELYLRWATGMQWGNILLTHIWKPSWNYASLAISWVLAVIPGILILCTAYSFRDMPCPFKGKRGYYLAGWVVTAAARWLPSLLTKGVLCFFDPGQNQPLGGALNALLFWVETLGDWGLAALLCGMLAWTFSLFRKRGCPRAAPTDPQEH